MDLCLQEASVSRERDNKGRESYSQKFFKSKNTRINKHHQRRIEQWVIRKYVAFNSGKFLVKFIVFFFFKKKIEEQESWSVILVDPRNAVDITIFWVSETSISVLLYDVMSPCWCDSFQRRRRSLWSLPIPKNVINFLSREEGLSIFLEPFLRDWTVWVDSTVCTVVLCWITRSFALRWST